MGTFFAVSVNGTQMPVAGKSFLQRFTSSTLRQTAQSGGFQMRGNRAITSR